MEFSLGCMYNFSTYFLDVALYVLEKGHMMHDKILNCVNKSVWISLKRHTVLGIDQWGCVTLCGWALCVGLNNYLHKNNMCRWVIEGQRLPRVICSGNSILRQLDFNRFLLQKFDKMQIEFSFLLYDWISFFVKSLKCNFNNIQLGCVIVFKYLAVQK